MWLLDCAAPRNVLDLTFLTSIRWGHQSSKVTQHQVTLIHSGHPNRLKVRCKYSCGALSMCEW